MTDKTQEQTGWERPTLNDKELPYTIRKRADGKYDVKLDRPLSEEEVVEQIGASYQTIDGLLDECKMGRKRSLNILKGFAGMLACLASMSAITLFSQRNNELVPKGYTQALEQRANVGERAYSLMQSNRFDEARVVMSNYFNSVKGER